MSALDPKAVFERLHGDFPRPLQKHLVVVGSLAAAYHFRAALEDRAVNTKDADIVVHPAGHVSSCKRVAERLFADRWTRRDTSYPQKRRMPLDDLRAIRIYPPGSREYFVEFLAMPRREQVQDRRWVPVRIASPGHEGWYGLPSYRFMGLAAGESRESHVGLRYATPRMMALANLLSHPTIGSQMMSTPVAGRPILRSAKDLGRVLAIAYLDGSEAVAAWPAAWRAGLSKCFPRTWRRVARTAGAGLTALLGDRNALEQAHHTVRIGLLRGSGVTQENLRVVAEQVLDTAVAPLIRSARERPR